MKAIWTGAVGFGLVNIPIKIYSAIESSQLDLDMLDKNDLSHIRFVRTNENTGKEVKNENIVKGYKYDDRYVILGDEDFERANAKKNKLIEKVSTNFIFAVSELYSSKIFFPISHTFFT